MVNKNKAQKSSKKMNEEIHEPVTNRDQSEQVVTNCDQLEKGEISLIQQDIKGLIRTIRGQQVMLDFDLAKLYGVTTGRLNEQVKRNINRFPNDFMFQLTKSELGLLKSQIATSKSAESQQDKVLISQIVTSKPIERRGGTQKPPYAFTRKSIGRWNKSLAITV